MPVLCARAFAVFGENYAVSFNTLGNPLCFYRTSLTLLITAVGAGRHGPKVTVIKNAVTETATPYQPRAKSKEA